MASKGTPLGIGLSIDFSQLDADLSSVANRIDRVGANTQLKVGTLSGMSDKGKGLDVDNLSAQMGRVGVSLSNSVSSGVGIANAMLLKIAARMNAVTEHMYNAMITMFNRVDVAMKGHRWTNLLTGLSLTLGNFASGSGKALSPLDKAMGGAFGGIAKKISAILNDLFERLAATISRSMDKAAKAMGESMDGAAKSMAKSFKPTLKSIEDSFKRLSDRMVATMLHAIDTIMVKMKGFASQGQTDLGKLGVAITSAQYLKNRSQFAGQQKRVKPVIEDVEIKLKPPSSASEHRLAKSIAEGMGEIPIDLNKMFKEKTKVKLPPLPKPTEPAPPKGSVMPPRVPQPSGWHAPMVLEPGKLSGLGAMAKAALDTVKQIIATIGKVPTAFGAAVDSGNRFAVAVAIIGTAFYEVGHLTVELVGFTARVAAGAGAMGLAFASAVGRSISFFQTLGGVGKKTYGELFSSNNIFAAGVLATVKTVYHLARGLMDIITLKAFRRVGDDAAQAKGAVGALGGAVGKLSSSVGRLAVEFAAALGVVGLVYKVVEFFKSGVKGATELNATVAQSKATFGESFGGVAEQAEKNAKAFHTSKGAQLELASAFGGMAQGAGISEQKSASLANKLTQLAVDAGGVGIGMNEIGDAMKTGLSGRAISLKQFAVNIDDNTTKAYAWKTGIAKVGEELTMQQTLMSRAGQVMRGLSYIQGSMTKGVSQAGVQFKMAGGGMALFAEKIGEIMLPGLKAAATGFNELMGGALDLLQVGGPAIGEWANAGAGFVTDFIKMIKEFGPTVVANISWAWEESKKGPLGFVTEGAEKIASFVKFIPTAIGIAIRNAGTIWEIAKVEVGTFVDNAIAYFNTIPANFQIMFPWLQRNWKNILVDIGNMINAFMDNVGANIKNLATAIWNWLNGKEFKFNYTPLLEGFAATTEKLPELIKPPIKDASEEVGKLWDKIKANEANLPKFKGGEEGPAGMKQKPILPEEKKREYKLGGALEAGSKEAFSAIAKGQSGKSSTTDAVKQGVAIQREQLQVSKAHMALAMKQQAQKFDQR